MALSAASFGPATTAAVADSCPNAAFRTGPSASLPDCRAYEQVTPADKAGSNDMFLNLPSPQTAGHAADDGDKVLLTTASALGSNADGLTAIDYVFSRYSSGWRFTPIEPPGAGDTHYALSALGTGVYSPDLSRVGPLSLTGSAATQSSTTPESLSFGAPGGPYTTIATTTHGNVPEFSAATTDFVHIFFSMLDHSLAQPAAGQVAGSSALYEWTDGHIQLVNVTTGGALTSPCGASLGAAGQFGGFGTTHNAVSSDGSKVFFVTPEPGVQSLDPSCSQPQHLDMRVNGSPPRTVDVSAPNPGVSDPDGFQPVAFVGAAADGSRVFFATTTELTADDTTHDFELYEYDTASGTLTRVSRGVSGDADGKVQWALVSDDGSTVYFAAAGQLAPGAPALTPPPAGSLVNLYRYDTATRSTRFIATVKGTDGFQQLRSQPFDLFVEVFAANSQSDWYTTPDGRFLLFGSSADLAGYDPGNCNSISSNGGKCQELYRYDAAGGSLTCVSCPGTSPATGDAEFVSETELASDVRTPRPISNDGSYVFFDTPDALVPQDTNGHRDVYEWHNGTMSLISSGKDPTDSLFVDSSSDGSNVFFGTHAELAPTDTDFEGDLYDARIAGGFPAPPGAASCSGDACQGPPSAPPLLATVTFSGPGNVSAGAGTTSKVNVLSRVVHGATFFVRVKVPGKGRITITGKDITRVSRTAARAGTYHVKVTLTAKDKGALKRKRKLKLMLRVGYTPAGGQASAATVRLTVRPAVKRPSRAHKARQASPNGGGAR